MVTVYTYFVFYRGLESLGSCVMYTKRPIDSIEKIRDFEKKRFNKNMRVQNFQLLKTKLITKKEWEEEYSEEAVYGN